MSSPDSPTMFQTISTPSMTTNASNMTTKAPNGNGHPYNMVLLPIYSVVLLSGIISLSFMVHVMKSSTTSITSIAVLNLIFAHFLFLVTVPFRIYYYASNHWDLGQSWCKAVSSMIHIHMYMSFFLYVIILVSRLLAFYHRAEQTAPFRRFQALLISAAVWVLVLVTVPVTIKYSYGTNTEEKKDLCFQFGNSIKSGAKVINYIVCMLIIVVATVLTALQANVLRILYRKHSEGSSSQQEFGAQLKSMCFALIMVVCFVPYHMFRLHYLENLYMEGPNEVFLSLTTFNCLDMLTFLGRRNCYMCFLRGVA
ncbi:probable G-protein coupled receptor 141 [Cheilinus undulatus]|uniref:probable G-protein coupled receptor 141 n=1 Tax=Cheilinus undulatus TaxID=241271 RepID=UPI001BD53432|nr:probable G-protein coupled receptor 141 [Cheilinus undulatus]XP_041670347.1 probable G-protein coupled receptor 141 [Cheilinus undulatus]XP_041670348.1 probable G-protein coupled receptor 141 [Cheilinus undulatus]XP_041670349.1 probable G-protein coupled receptor 141 [Cheilinus undulatus]